MVLLIYHFTNIAETERHHIIACSEVQRTGHEGSLGRCCREPDAEQSKAGQGRVQCFVNTNTNTNNHHLRHC